MCLGTVYGNINIHASDKSVRLKLSLDTAILLSVGFCSGQVLENLLNEFVTLHF